MRRPAPPRLIERAGEGCASWAPDPQVVYQHLHRYLWSAELLGSVESWTWPAENDSVPPSWPTGPRRSGVVSPGACPLLSGPQAASRWLEPMHEHASDARIVYDAVDPHWLREAGREAADAGVGLDKGALVRDAMTGVWRPLGDVPVTIIGVYPPAEVERSPRPM